MDAITELRRQRTRPPTFYRYDFENKLQNEWWEIIYNHPKLRHIEMGAAIRDFQAQAGITADGICGPETWSHLAKRDGSPGERTVQVALQEAYSGAREIGGNNRGEWVERYGGKQWKYPWCVKFAVWCYERGRNYFLSFHEEHIPADPWGNLWSPRASSSALVKWGQENNYHWGRPCAPHTGECVCPGDTFVVVKGGRTGYKHTALLLDIDGDDIWVVEGNVRPRKWMPWQRDVVRVGKYKAPQVVFVQPED